MTSILPYLPPLYYNLKLAYLALPSFSKEAPKESPDDHPQIREIIQRVLFDEYTHHLEQSDRLIELLSPYATCETKDAIEALQKKIFQVKIHSHAKGLIYHTILDNTRPLYQLRIHEDFDHSLYPFFVAREIGNILEEKIISISVLKAIVSLSAWYFMPLKSPIYLMGGSVLLTELAGALYDYQARLDADYFAMNHCTDEELQSVLKFYKDKSMKSWRVGLYSKLQNKLTKRRIESVLKASGIA